MVLHIGPGKLDRRIAFERLPNANTDERDESGELIGGPVMDFCGVPANFKTETTRSLREFEASEKRHSQARAIFTIRYTSRIRSQVGMATHQIVYVEDASANPKITRRFDIESISVIGRRRWMEIEVNEVL